ncbi:MAG TPA: exodeoxyribonuclease V subunit alpha [Acidimicrobiales bacterium]|jgi:exodeoxyribonuclease V alpha subunit|nr:exodeoxyribonuclease V subunit alpha [Acidimicrobiales bacterium]
MEPFDARLALDAPRSLRPFNNLGVLSAADVHVALCLEGLGGKHADAVLLGIALAVRAPRLGHVCVDLATAHDTTTTDSDSPVDVRGLAWPDPGDWVAQMAASTLVGYGDDAPADRPLRLNGTLLYLDRYWRQERQVAADLRARSERPAAGVDVDVLAAGLDRLFADPPALAPRAAPPTGPDLQKLASASAVLRGFAVVAGGPGTGKTTTVARILALLDEQAMARGVPPPRIALAAPTGKAAARLQEAVHHEAARLPVGAQTRTRLGAVSASTLHRLLGWRPDSHSRFRHDQGNRLPHDVVIVDETSMVSLSLMAKLVGAMRSDARLVLVGDPEQLASVEAGAVLGDIVGPASRGLRMRAPSRAALASVTGQAVAASDPPEGIAVGDGIVFLRRVHRYGGGIADLAGAIQLGDGPGAVGLLRDGGTDIAWIDADVAAASGVVPLAHALAAVRAEVVRAGKACTTAARAGDAATALAALASTRLLCAHRRGPYGVSSWTSTIERWLAEAIDGYASEGVWYPGRPLLVTENDYELQLYNGDTGVVVATGTDRVAAVFERRGELVEVGPSRLSAVQTLHAMTVHKSQGSQFDAVTLVLPDAASAILTRQLLYTAVTRARRHVAVVGPEASVLAAVARPIARASGLGPRLWNQPASG